MPLLSQVSREEAEPFIQELYEFVFGDDRDPIENPGTPTGTPGDWWTVFALSPPVLKHCVDSFQMFRPGGLGLDAKLREIGQVRIGFVCASQFVFSQHCKAARSVGVTDEKVAEIPEWQTSRAFSDVERAVLAFADSLALQGGRVGERTMKILQRNLSDQHILELGYVLATYAMHASLVRAFRLEYDDIPERIVEIAAPEGGDEAMDVMSMVDKET